MSESFSSRFTMGLFSIFFALAAYRSVPSVSAAESLAGDTQAIISVLAFPPSESMSSRVSLESR